MSTPANHVKVSVTIDEQGNIAYKIVEHGLNTSCKTHDSNKILEHLKIEGCTIDSEGMTPEGFNSRFDGQDSVVKTKSTPTSKKDVPIAIQYGV